MLSTNMHGQICASLSLLQNYIEVIEWGPRDRITIICPASFLLLFPELTMSVDWNGEQRIKLKYLLHFGESDRLAADPVLTRRNEVPIYVGLAAPRQRRR